MGVTRKRQPCGSRSIAVRKPQSGLTSALSLFSSLCSPGWCQSGHLLASSFVQVANSLNYFITDTWVPGTKLKWYLKVSLLNRSSGRIRFSISSSLTPTGYPPVQFNYFHFLIYILNFRFIAEIVQRVPVYPLPSVPYCWHFTLVWCICHN